MTEGSALVLKLIVSVAPVVFSAAEDKLRAADDAAADVSLAVDAAADVGFVV